MGCSRLNPKFLNFFRTTPHSSWVIFTCLRFSFGTQPSSPHQLSPVSFSSMNVNFDLVMKSLCVRLLKKVPSLVKGRRDIPLVTDEEVGIYQVI